MGNATAFDLNFEVPAYNNKNEVVSFGFIFQDKEVNNNIKCTLWVNYVDDLLPFVEADSEDNIMLIEFGRISIFGDQIRVCNSFNVTKITMNGESRIFQNFNEGLANSGSVSAPLTTMESVFASNIYDAFKNTKANLRDNTNPKSFNYVPKEIEEALTDRVGLFKVQVREIDQSRNSVTNNCFRLTIIYYYTKRYKIEVLFLDESGSARFMLWDKECYELIGKKAADVIKSNPN
ncbi:hypothetical protein OROGR_013015 [Orobanche gracilis]